MHVGALRKKHAVCVCVGGGGGGGGGKALLPVAPCPTREWIYERKAAQPVPGPTRITGVSREGKIKVPFWIHMGISARTGGGHEYTAGAPDGCESQQCVDSGVRCVCVSMCHVCECAVGAGMYVCRAVFPCIRTPATIQCVNDDAAGMHACTATVRACEHTLWQEADANPSTP